MNIIKYLLVFVVLFLMNNAYCKENVQMPDFKRFSIGINGLMLKDVIVELNKKSGYKIIVEEELGIEKITGNYFDTTLDDFFRRVFKGKNIVLEFNESDNTLVVKLFGSSFGSVASVSKKELEEDVWYKKEQLSKDDEMRKMQIEQLEAFERWQKDPLAIDPMTGLERGVMQAQKDEQASEFERWQKDPDAIDPMTGLNKGELKEMQKKQLESFSQQKKEEIIPKTEMRRGEIKVKQAEQLSSYEQWKNNPDSLDPMTGMRRGDLKAMQERQLAEFEKNLKRR